MTKLNIGVLTEIVNGSSGARAPLEIAKHLADRGHQVTVYAYNYFEDKTMRRYLENNGVQVTTLDKPRWSRYLIVPNIFNKIKKSKHNVLYFSGTPPFFIAGFLSRIPIVRMYQGTQFDAYLERFLPNQTVLLYHQLLNKLINRIIYLIDFMSFRLSVAVVAISQFAANEGKTLYGRHVFDVIYHGSRELSSTHKRFTSASTVELISVSRLTPYKGFHKVINALNQMQTDARWRLTIVGSQPKTQYVMYLKNLGQKNIRILSNVSDAELDKLYARSNIYVTCDRYLYFGLPIMEAAHFGIPTVAYDFAAAKEVVASNKTGMVAKSEQELSQTLKKLIEQPKLRNKMGSKAKERAKQFSWELCAQRWERVLLNFSKKIEL